MFHPSILTKFFSRMISSFIFTTTLLTLPLTAALSESNSNSPSSQEARDFRDVAKTATPAVVSIKVEGTQKQSSWSSGDDENGNGNLFNEDFLQKFFGLQKRQNEPQTVAGQASGFIISPDGYILTNSHVVKGMSEIIVTTNDGKEYRAKVIGMDPNTDVAVIKIEAKDLPYLKFGNSDNLEVGQWVVAIGTPLGLQASLTAGVVSAKGRNNLDISGIEDYIQTDAAINRGNSGGPLLNLNSEVVGMNTAIVTNMATGGYMGIGFAIPSNLLKRVMEDLKKDGSFKRGFLGVALQSVDENLAQSFGLANTNGALVAEVSKGSPAEKGGIKQGDIILKYNDQTVTNIGALRNAVSMIKPGSKIILSILRNGKPIELSVEVGLFPSSETVATNTSSSKDNKLGIEVENLSSELADKLGYTNEKGVVITNVDLQGPIAWAGVKKGALILEINKQKVTNIDEFNKSLKQIDNSKPILLLIKQGDVTRFVSFKIG